MRVVVASLVCWSSACGGSPRAAEPTPKTPEPVSIPEPEAAGPVADEPAEAAPSRERSAPSGRTRTCTSDGDRAEAKRAFQAGVEAYQEADYERAAELFEQAYAESCATPILFNIGNALERAGKPAAAADALEAYLAENRELPLADEIRERIERLRDAAP